MAKDYAADFQEVEQEIGRLMRSSHVALANRARQTIQQRRQLMYELRELEELGRTLEDSGITWEYLDELTNGDVDWREQYG